MNEPGTTFISYVSAKVRSSSVGEISKKSAFFKNCASTFLVVTKRDGPPRFLQSLAPIKTILIDTIDKTFAQQELR